MDIPTQVLIATAGFIVLTLVVTAVAWSRRQSVRTLLHGLGLAVIAAGAWITGILDLAGNGVQSLLDWGRRTPLDTEMIVGLVVAGLGALLWVIGSTIKPVTRTMAKERRAARATTSSQTAPAKAVTQGRPAPAAKAPAPAIDPEDAEIEALLRQRGIE